MQQRDSVGDARDEGTDGEAVAADIEAVAASAGEVFGQAVGLVIRKGKLLDGHLKSNVAEVADRRNAVMRNLVDVEGELGLNMLALSLGVVHLGAVFCAEAGKLDRHGKVDGRGVTNRVADVVGERAGGEGEFIGVSGIAEEADDEVPGTDVVSQVREQPVAERIVAHVLDHASGVCIGACSFQIGGGQVWIATEQQRNNRILPGEVDELLMREQGVGVGAPLPRKQQQQDQQHPRSQHDCAPLSRRRLNQDLPL